MKIVREITKFKLEENEVDKIRDFVEVLSDVCDEISDDGCEKCPFYKIGICNAKRQVNFIEMVGNLYNNDYIEE